MSLKWETVDFTETTMEIQLTFDSPNYVSNEAQEQDNLLLIVKDPSFMVSKQSRIPLSKDQETDSQIVK